MHSGSVAWVLSSMRMERNCILARRGSPAPTHVQQMTSAFCTTHKQPFIAAVIQLEEEVSRMKISPFEFVLSLFHFCLFCESFLTMSSSLSAVRFKAL